MTIYGTIFLKTLTNIFVWNLKWLKFDIVSLMFDYEISKEAIIHIDFIKHFSKYCDFQKIASIKIANVIIIVFKFKNRI
jgi:hypothetical protein